MAELLVTLGVGAKTAGTIATVATLAGPVLSTLGAVQRAGEAKQQSAEFSRQAREERVAASIRAERMRRQSRLQQSAERTAMVEGGALSGTAIGVLDQNAVAQELDALTVEYQGQQAGAAADFRAKQARKAASPLNIFSTAVSSFSQMDPLNIGGQV